MLHFIAIKDYYYCCYSNNHVESVLQSVVISTNRPQFLSQNLASSGAKTPWDVHKQPVDL